MYTEANQLSRVSLYRRRADQSFLVLDLLLGLKITRYLHSDSFASISDSL